MITDSLLSNVVFTKIAVPAARGLTLNILCSGGVGHNICHCFAIFEKESSECVAKKQKGFSNIDASRNQNRNRFNVFRQFQSKYIRFKVCDDKTGRVCTLFNER